VTDQITKAMLLIRWVDGGQDRTYQLTITSSNRL